MTLAAVNVGFKASSYDFALGGHHAALFIGIPALAVNLAIAAGGTLLTSRQLDAVPATSAG